MTKQLKEEFSLTFQDSRILEMFPIKTDSEIKYCAERLYWITAEFTNELSTGERLLDPDEMLHAILNTLRDEKDVWKDISDVGSFLVVVAYSLHDLLKNSDCKLIVSRDFFANQFFRSVEFKWAVIRSIFHQYRFFYRDHLLNLGFDELEAKSIIESCVEWCETATAFYYSYEKIVLDFVNEIVRVCSEKGKLVSAELFWLTDFGEMPVSI